MTHKRRGVRVEEYAYYVNKLRQNVGLETRTVARKSSIGGLYVCAGEIDNQIWQKFHQLMVFHISILGAWSVVWGVLAHQSPPWRRDCWKHEYDFTLWRHKQRTPNTNDHHMPLNNPTHDNFLRTSLTNGHIEIHGYSLEDPGVINTESD